MPADGAGLSLFSKDFRVPLGAAGAHAQSAERLQFTLGDGPCLTAAQSQSLLVAGPQELIQRWPTYADELRNKTPYQAVVTVPFLLDATPGVIDLYLIDASKLREFKLADAAIVAEATRNALAASGRTDFSSDIDQTTLLAAGWLAAAPARDRLTVWVAIGILTVAADLAAPDALAVMRSYAYARSQTVDEIAAGLVSGDLDPATFGQ
jgi:hypothetical protein